MDSDSGCIGQGFGCLVLIVLAVAWLTHLYVCFTAGHWGFLIAGAIFFPIAIVHGIGVWFGVWH